MQHLKKRIKLAAEIIVAAAMIYLCSKTYYAKRFAPDQQAPVQKAAKTNSFHAQTLPSQ